MAVFDFIELESPVLTCSGTWKENGLYQKINLFLSNRRIVFLKPNPGKDTRSTLLMVLATVAICAAIVTVAVLTCDKPPKWMFPICAAAIGGMSFSIGKLKQDPTRYELLYEIPQECVKIIECRIDTFKKPEFCVKLDDGSVIEFTGTAAWNTKCKELFAERFQLFKNGNQVDNDKEERKMEKSRKVLVIFAVLFGLFLVGMLGYIIYITKTTPHAHNSSFNEIFTSVEESFTKGKAKIYIRNTGFGSQNVPLELEIDGETKVKEVFNPGKSKWFELTPGKYHVILYAGDKDSGRINRCMEINLKENHIYNIERSAKKSY